MLFYKTLAYASVFTVSFTAAVTIASPANATASPSSTSLQCQRAGLASFTNQTGRNFSGDEGDLLTITNPGGSGFDSVTYSIPAGFTVVSGSLTVDNTNPTLVIRYGSSSGRLSALGTAATGSCSPTTSNFVDVVISGGGSSSGTSGTLDSNPTPVLQQFGKPATGACDAAQPEMLNIGGAESGGWRESWAEWMNGGLGGAVCTRTLVYSNNLAKWIVG